MDNWTSAGKIYKGRTALQSYGKNNFPHSHSTISNEIKDKLFLMDRIVETKRESKEVFGMQTQKSTGNLPEKKFKAGAVQATVWLNKGQNKKGEEVGYRSISLDRNYLDKDGKWQNTSSLRVNDLPKASIVLQKAYEYLVLNGENEDER
ncbi:MAG: hypothetical protein ABIA37_02120 [Candidatus Woesearchaeota archaeon]